MEDGNEEDDEDEEQTANRQEQNRDGDHNQHPNPININGQLYHWEVVSKQYDVYYASSESSQPKTMPTTIKLQDQFDSFLSLYSLQPSFECDSYGSDHDSFEYFGFDLMHLHSFLNDTDWIRWEKCLITFIPFAK